MHDESRAVGIGQQDGFENLLAGDRRYGMTLGGADAPVCGVGGPGGAGSGEGCAEGSGGVEFDLVALFVAGGDDGLELGEVNF